MSKRPLLIFPSGGNAWEALDCLGESYEAIAFVDDDLSQHGSNRLGLPIYGREAFDQYPDAQVLAVLGSPTSFSSKQKVIEGLDIAPERWATVIHPSAHISPRATIGRNCLVMAGVVITANATIQDHIVVLPLSVIHHDTLVQSYTSIGSQVVIAGHTQVGHRCYIGSGSNLINGITIGDDALIGMGSNVLQDVPNQTKVVGNPARPIAL